jgi:hypothetical protein
MQYPDTQSDDTMLKTLLAKLLRRFGYEVIASSKVTPSSMSRLLQALFK